MILSGFSGEDEISLKENVKLTLFYNCKYKINETGYILLLLNNNILNMAISKTKRQVIFKYLKVYY